MKLNSIFAGLSIVSALSFAPTVFAQQSTSPDPKTSEKGDGAGAAVPGECIPCKLAAAAQNKGDCPSPADTSCKKMHPAGIDKTPVNTSEDKVQH